MLPLILSASIQLALIHVLMLLRQAFAHAASPHAASLQAVSLFLPRFSYLIHVFFVASELLLPVSAQLPYGLFFHFLAPARVMPPPQLSTSVPSPLFLRFQFKMLHGASQH